MDEKNRTRYRQDQRNARTVTECGRASTAVPFTGSAAITSTGAEYIELVCRQYNFEKSTVRVFDGKQPFAYIQYADAAREICRKFSHEINS
jgi:hypothetical protein